MPHVLIRRAVAPALALAAAGILTAACNSSTSGSGSSDTGGSSSQATDSFPSSDGQDLSSASTPSSDSLGGDDSSSNVAPPTPSTSSAGGGGGGSAAEFCAVFKKDLSSIQNAGSDPTAAIKTFEDLDDVAPPEIKPSVDVVVQELHKAQGGAAPDYDKIRDEAEKVGEYYGTNCH